MRPFWERKELNLVDAGEPGWTESAFVLFKDVDLPELLPELQNLSCSALKTEDWRRTAQLIATSPNLRGVDLGTLSCSEATKSFADSLQKTPQLNEVRFELDHDDVNATRVLFDSLGKLSLTFVQVLSSLSTLSVFAEQLCLYLQTAQSLEYVCIVVPEDEEFDAAFCRRLSTAPFASKSLQTLIFEFSLNCACVEIVLNAIQNPSRLRKLLLSTASADSLPAFEKYFASSNCFWALRELSVSSSSFVSAGFLQLLVQNTRLQVLGVSDFLREKHEEALLESNLLDEGWLTELSAFSRQRQSIQHKLVRNKIRHERCKRLSTGLIAMRRKKRILINFPMDLVRIIARYLWETRNNSNKEQWDVVQ